MDETKYAEIKGEIVAQGKEISEIKDTQIKIANALLGSFDKSSVGLIEEVRSLAKLSHDNAMAIKTLEQEALNQQNFRRDAKKLIMGLALVVPFAFDIIKGMATLFWEYLKTSK